MVVVLECRRFKLLSITIVAMTVASACASHTEAPERLPVAASLSATDGFELVASGTFRTARGNDTVRYALYGSHVASPKVPDTTIRQLVNAGWISSAYPEGVHFFREDECLDISTLNKGAWSDDIRFGAATAIAETKVFPGVLKVTITRCR
jgi:hypothetical protein